MNKLMGSALVCAAAMLVMVSCDKGDGNDENGTVSQSTETTAEFDDSNFGLYKGVIAGSSGTIRIEIKNGNGVATANLTIDGESDELSSSYTFIEGQAIVNAEFTGEFSSFTFSVGADGEDPTIIAISLDGHDNVIATISKETSDDVTSCYEGTSTGGQGHSGIFNLVRNNNTFSGAGKAVDGFSLLLSGNIRNDGSFSATSKTIFNGLDVTVNYSGKFNGNDVSGTWSNSWNGGSNGGGFSGEKTL
jgi:hypothetical protein